MPNKSKAKELFQYATAEELANSINLAFNKLVTSEDYTELQKQDRERIVFHWELFRDFLMSTNQKFSKSQLNKFILN